jgi:hypothetical protein
VAGRGNDTLPVVCPKLAPWDDRFLLTTFRKGGAVTASSGVRFPAVPFKDYGANLLYLLDADLGGSESVQDLIETERIVEIPLPSFVAFEKAAVQLCRTVTKDDVVVVDTLSALANTTRGDLRLGPEEPEDLWSKRSLFFGADKNYLTQYEATEKMIMRHLKNLKTRCHIITIVHEDEQVDPISMTKKRAPQLNQAFFGSLMASASDVFRLSMLFEDVKNSQGNVVHKAGTRVLYLQSAEGPDGHIAKHRTSREVAETIPKGIVDPTMPKLMKTLQKNPRWLVIYGPPGIGKTTFACSQAYEEK